MDTEEKLMVLAKVARALNAAGIVWAVGASALLFLEGAADDFADFDVLVAPMHLEAACTVFQGLNAHRRPAAPPAAAYASEGFVEFTLHGVEFDLLSNFAIRRKDGVYRYPFDEDRIARTHGEGSARVPLCPLADWFVLYLLMPGRSKKATLISRHLKASQQTDSRAWLSLWLRSRLPGDVRENVMKLYDALG